MARTPLDVDTQLAARAHPLRDWIEVLRPAIRGVDPGIVELWKWNAPSYAIRGVPLVTFMLRPDDHLHLVWHHPAVPDVEDPLLEGEYPDGRRMTYLRSEVAVRDAVPGIEGILRRLVAATPPDGTTARAV
ncbi:DUF1801 domain-containing protein [Homoserinibacter sp. YIM 151385]|uniref:DUF1801 domain-containing protein n=1 Tax=Homoserinibacter sp. YIM 151385 TaxID=2985506 RepID=UPI0022F0D40E|nr:DUF1801 domain-containing protein [Homoserinibacter sp. YIM 151385]WBU37436.1 DUF1801 domain-containing protein [Homoserinibacter sp. YIM 151385]